jgi:murein DD-endopeptidase MepM/ murein hydrolase activator NlpD
MNKTMRLPLQNTLVTQGFGETDFAKAHPTFYKDGKHHGIDFRARAGTPVYASIGGVAVCYETKGGGKTVKIIDGLRTLFYCHLEKWIIDSDTIVKEGQMLGLTGNSGVNTTAEHLHYELQNNGVPIDPSSFFDSLHTGEKIKNKDWERSRAYHRYGRKQNWFAEFCFKFTPIKIQNTWVKSGQWVQKRLVSLGLKRLNDDQINAILYGSWDFDSVINPGLMTTALYLTKEEFLSGKKPFLS